MSRLLEAALKYAGIGWHVFPIVPGLKRPLTAHGVKDATTDRGQIRTWWTDQPEANIGLACGAKSGVYAVDIDLDAGKGIDGYASIKPYSPLPPTVSQSTPRGGVHAFFRTDNPPANKNGLLPGVDVRGEGYYVLLAPSVSGSGKGYEWLEGMSPFEAGLAEYPDSLRIEPKGHDQAPQIAPAAVSEPAASVNGDTLRRAAAYLQECDPAVQGRSGHDKLLWAAVAMVHGFMLSEGDAHRLLAREYNTRCTPPWDLVNREDARDFSRKVTEAMKLTPSRQRGWLLEEAIPDNVDIENIIKVANAEEAENSDIEEKFGKMPFDWPEDISRKGKIEYLTTPTGLLGSICAWINSTARRPQPMLTLAGSLSFLGTLYGRRVRGEDDSRTNLYCIGAAPSSAGKNHAMNKIRLLAAAGGCSDRIGGTKFASEAAIEKRLSKNPAMLFMCDEIGHKLSSMKNDKTGHRTDIVSTLMELYSMATETFVGKEYATQEPRTLVQPCCSLYGVSEHGRLAKAIDPDELSDGWIARCMVFDCGNVMPDAVKPSGQGNPPNDVIEAVREWSNLVVQPVKKDMSDFITISNGHAQISADLPPNLVDVPYSDGAIEVFDSLDRYSISRWNRGVETSPLWMKTTEKAKRIAIILAASDNSTKPAVSRKNAVYACRLVTYLLKEFESGVVNDVSSCVSEYDRKRMLKAIRNAGKDGIPKESLGRKTQWSTKRYRDAMLVDLIESCYIVEIDINRRDHAKPAANGRVYKKFSYWATEHFNEEEYGYKTQPNITQPGGGSGGCAASPEQNPGH